MSTTLRTTVVPPRDDAPEGGGAADSPPEQRTEGGKEQTRHHERVGEQDRIDDPGHVEREGYRSEADHQGQNPRQREQPTFEAVEGATWRPTMSSTRLPTLASRQESAVDMMAAK